MPTLLKLLSSPRTDSVSNKLANAFSADWKQKNPGATIYEHNTTLEKIPYLDEATINAFYTPEAALTDEQKKLLALSDQLIDELAAADIIVIGAPMWNLGIPASLKAWIDQIVRVGKTFAYSSNGFTALLPKGKKVYVFSSRGGAYSGESPARAWDQFEPYVRTSFGFLGLTDIEFVYAENQNRAPEAIAAGLAKAESQIEALLA